VNTSDLVLRDPRGIVNVRECIWKDRVRELLRTKAPYLSTTFRFRQGRNNDIDSFMHSKAAAVRSQHVKLLEDIIKDAAQVVIGNASESTSIVLDTPTIHPRNGIEIRRKIRNTERYINIIRDSGEIDMRRVNDRSVLKRPIAETHIGPFTAPLGKLTCRFSLDPHITLHVKLIEELRPGLARPQINLIENGEERHVGTVLLQMTLLSRTNSEMGLHGLHEQSERAMEALHIVWLSSLTILMQACELCELFALVREERGGSLSDIANFFTGSINYIGKRLAMPTRFESMELQRTPLCVTIPEGKIGNSCECEHDVDGVISTLIDIGQEYGLSRPYIRCVGDDTTPSIQDILSIVAQEANGRIEYVRRPQTFSWSAPRRLRTYESPPREGPRRAVSAQRREVNQPVPADTTSGTATTEEDVRIFVNGLLRNLIREDRNE
jgi:hypothetical protein